MTLKKKKTIISHFVNKFDSKIIYLIFLYRSEDNHLLDQSVEFSIAEQAALVSSLSDVSIFSIAEQAALVSSLSGVSIFSITEQAALVSSLSGVSIFSITEQAALVSSLSDVIIFSIAEQAALVSSLSDICIKGKHFIPNSVKYICFTFFIT